MKNVLSLINKNCLVSCLGDFFSSKKQVIEHGEKPLITISREVGSGGRPIADLVVKKLSPPWKLYHKDIIDKIAKEAKLQKRLVEEIDEQKRPLVEELTMDLFGKKYANLTTYYKSLIRVLIEIGQKGYGVIIGRGANFLFPHALNVRIICQMEQRIKWVMEFEKVSQSETMRRIAESDQKRSEFVRTLFHHDIKKAHHYDLIIRTGPELDIEMASDLIVLAAKKRFKF
jgi:cytidylate kinase